MVNSRSTRSRRKVVTSSPENDPDGDSSWDESKESHNNTKKKRESSLNAFPARSHGQATLASGRGSAVTSTGTTPHNTPKKKSPQKRKSSGDKPIYSKPIYSFFNAATQQQQPLPSSADNETHLPHRGDSIPEDLIEEDTTEDEFNTSSFPKRTVSTNSTGSNKRSHDDKAEDGNHLLTSGSRKFLKALDGSRSSPSFSHDPEDRFQDDRPWADKYAPQNLEELAVHKKKVSDVRSWVDSVLNRQSIRRLLVLKGPAGVGKTCTIKVLSKLLGFDCLEWSNPAYSGAASDDMGSQNARFEDFLMRGRKFGGLEMVGEEELAPTGNPISELAETSKHILLVEEFPTATTRSSDAGSGIRSILSRFLAANTPSMSSWGIPKEETPSPVVLIISESVMSSNSTPSETFTAHRLLGPDLLSHPGTTVIEFNPVAPTFLSKAQTLVLQKHANATGNRYAPSQVAMQRLAEFGDLRSSINTLEYLCARKATGSGFIAQPFLKGKVKKTKKPVTQSEDTLDLEKTELSIISSRESTLGLFHAVGKVVYNKRSQQIDESVRLPPHQAPKTRQLISDVDITTLLDSTGTDSATFMAALHENYVLSCSPVSGNPDDTLASIEGCLDNLCDADILDRTTSFRARNYAPGEGLRQQELAFELGVRGLLFNLPHPVKRQPKPGSKNYLDANKMYYPTSVKLWRRKEELSGKLDLFVQQALKGMLLNQKTTSASKPTFSGGKSSISQPGRMQNSKANVKECNASTITNSEDSNVQRALLGSGHSPKQEMLLERVPYMVAIVTSATQVRKTHLSTSYLKAMEEVTRFKGVGVLEDEESDEEAGAEAPVKSSKNANAFSAIKGLGKSEDLGVDNLVLSDDDIEDDEM